MHTTSESLLYRVRRADDHVAWQRFVNLYTPMIYRWSLRIGLPESEAADLAQEVLTTVCQKLPTFRYDESKSFRSWLKTVTSNRARDFIRNRATRREDKKQCVERIADNADQVEFLSSHEYNQALTRRVLDIMKNEFSEPTWKACWMVVVDDMPVAEVASILDISQNSVYLAKSPIMRRLRTELAGLLD